MVNPKITIRQATANDAVIIAKIVAMAIGDEAAVMEYCGDDYLATLAEIARVEQTQYSYQNTLLAEINGHVAGAAIGYDGAQLEILRNGTFSILQKLIGRVPHIPNETEPGEFYLDSIGVFPEFRGLGVGRALITALRDKAFREGHERVGLIVDVENPKAEKLYQAIGFRRIGSRIFFGHQMWHLSVNRQHSR